MEATKTFAVFISGYGRGAMEIIRDYRRGLIRPELRLLLSSQSSSPCLDFARSNGIATAVVRRRDFDSKQSFEHALVGVLQAHGIQYIYLAGWMHILGSVMIDAYRERIVNVHPSLLPSFKGLNGIQQAMDAGVKITGATTHFVDETIDGGRIIAQQSIKIREDDTFESIDNRLFKITTLLTLDTINRVFL